ncbi:MAG: hypothetical protein AAF658_15400, partial [Myxococcota bacterium]
MSKDKELDQRNKKIRKMQDGQHKSAKNAVEQAGELDDILAVSRAEHEGVDPDRPLRSASDLMGPGGRRPPRRSVDSIDTEGAYARNLAAAHFASPEAFSRNRSRPPTVLGPGSSGMGAGLRPSPIRSIQRPGQPASPTELSEQPTQTMVGENASPAEMKRDETTLVVRQRKTARDAGDAPSGIRQETLVVRARKIPQAAVNDQGEVV